MVSAGGNDRATHAPHQRQGNGERVLHGWRTRRHPETPEKGLFCHNAVFLLGAFADADIVLRHPPQHIHTFADVDDTFVYPNTVDASVSELIFKSLPLHPLVGVLLVGCHQNTNSSFLGGVYAGLSLPVATGREMTISLTFGTYISGLPSFSFSVFIPLSVPKSLLYISIFSWHKKSP